MYIQNTQTNFCLFLSSPDISIEMLSGRFLFLSLFYWLRYVRRPPESDPRRMLAYDGRTHGRPVFQLAEWLWTYGLLKIYFVIKWMNVRKIYFFYDSNKCEYELTLNDNDDIALNHFYACQMLILIVNQLFLLLYACKFLMPNFDLDVYTV